MSEKLSTNMYSKGNYFALFGIFEKLNKFKRDSSAFCHSEPKRRRISKSLRMTNQMKGKINGFRKQRRISC